MIEESNDPKNAPDKDQPGATQEDAGSGIGDVEAAGETTAAAVIGGEPDKRPVGADTLVKVEGDKDVKDSEDGQP